MPKNEAKPLPWYRDGLRFKCTGCGGCCTGSPGYVWVSDEEVLAIAELLKITPEEFVQRHCRMFRGKLSLKERPKSFDCVFLDGKRCSIYQYRPKQCRTFPWWIENIQSEESWKEAASYCEGINHPDAPTIPFEEISSQCSQ